MAKKRLYNMTVEDAYRNQGDLKDIATSYFQVDLTETELVVDDYYEGFYYFIDNCGNRQLLCKTEKLVAWNWK